MAIISLRRPPCISLRVFLFFFSQEKIAENYRKIRLRPDQFTEYLLSREVGFSKCETLAMPFNKGKGMYFVLVLFTDNLLSEQSLTPNGC